MYQKIDSLSEAKGPDMPVNTDAVPHIRPRLVALFIFVGVIITLIIGFYYKSPSDIIRDEVSVDGGKTTYHLAIGETDPALRRARLIDFIKVYEGSARRGAAVAQLKALNAAEHMDWIALTELFYDTQISQDDKRLAIEKYAKLWRSDFIGGREGRLEEFYQILDYPERLATLPPKNKNHLASTRGANTGHNHGVVLVGAAPIYRPRPARSTPVIGVAPKPLPLNITPARFTNVIKPKYPNRALERGIEADIVLRITVNKKGKVVNTELISAAADRYQKSFVSAAKRAARRSRYTPEKIGNTVSPLSHVNKTYRFRLQ